jgi:methionyl-tRNA synthetase
VNKYLSDQAPWKLANTDRDRMGTVLHTALQAVDDAKVLLTPFLPSSSARVHAALGGAGGWAPMPELLEVDEETAAGSPSYPVLTGDYSATPRWESTPLPAGRPLSAPTPVFTKLDPSVVDEELARLG